MKEIVGDIWDVHSKGHGIVITTNGSVKKNGACVMERGVALQAARKFSNLPISSVNRYADREIKPLHSHSIEFLHFQ